MHHRNGNDHPASFSVFYAASARKRQVLRTERALKSQDSDILRFDSNDYFNIRRDARVIDASIHAMRTGGSGAGASRLAGGNYPGIAAAEEQLAAHYGYQACVIFGSGYAANTGMIAALSSPGDMILADKYAHACMIDGAALSGAKLVRFRHNDVEHAEKLLCKHRASYARCLIMTETVFSMDGDAAPIADLSALAGRYDALLYADHAHGPGFVTPNADHIDILTGTFSKAFGSYGGYACMSDEAKRHIINTARPFIFSTALPPACVASAMEALRIITTEPERVTQVYRLRNMFLEACGYHPHVPLAGAIIPYLTGSNARAERLSAHMEQAFSIAVPAIRPPTVPPGTARLRIVVHSGHSEADIMRLADACNSMPD